MAPPSRSRRPGFAPVIDTAAADHFLDVTLGTGAVIDQNAFAGAQFACGRSSFSGGVCAVAGRSFTAIRTRPAISAQIRIDIDFHSTVGID